MLASRVGREADDQTGERVGPLSIERMFDSVEPWNAPLRTCSVIEGWAYPDAHDLAEHGWLERRFEPDGEMSLVVDTGR
jgi:hypothetical protein